METNILAEDDKAYLRINPQAKETRRLLVGKHPVYFAKGPTHQLGYTVANPTWPSLESALATGQPSLVTA